MNRRELIKWGVFGGAAGILTPQLLRAGEAQGQLHTAMGGGVYYTKASPGRWSKKVTSHLPNIEVASNSDGKKEVLVVTRHVMEGFDHYIVKHMLLDGNFGFLMEKMFDPRDTEYPESTFTLDAYSGPLYALSVCNQHDTWISTAEI